MKRRSSPRASPSPKRVSNSGSPSSVSFRSVQNDNYMNGKTQTANITHGHIEVESKTQIALFNQGISVKGSGDNEKMVMEFDLNAVPDDPPTSDAPLFIHQNDAVQGAAQTSDAPLFIHQNDVIQGAAQTSDTPIDVDTLHSVIDVCESPIQEDNAPVDDDEMSVYLFGNEIIVGRLSLSLNAANHLVGNIVQSSNASFDAELLGDRILSFLRDTVQVPNQSRGALPETIILDEDCDVNAGCSERPSTVLTLAPYQLQMPLTDFFNLERSNDTMNKNATTTTELEKQKSPEREKHQEPKESPFTCAVCWGPLKDETSTICGHIFCQTCIKAAIKAQRKCPTCRRTLNTRNIHRVYLPTEN